MADAAESQANVLKHNYAQACQACHDSHARCDLGRPCSRCIKRQTMTTCADMVYACTDLLMCKLAVLLLLLLLAALMMCATVARCLDVRRVPESRRLKAARGNIPRLRSLPGIQVRPVLLPSVGDGKIPQQASSTPSLLEAGQLQVPLVQM